MIGTINQTRGTITDQSSIRQLEDMNQPNTLDVGLSDLPIFVISLSRAEQRRRRLHMQLNRLGVEDHVRWYDAIDGASLGDEDIRKHCSKRGYRGFSRYRERSFNGTLTLGGLGCALSWKALLPDIVRPTLVLEDDAVFHDDFINRFAFVRGDIPADWELLYLSCNPYGIWMGKQLTACVMRVEKRLHGTGALLVHPHAVPKLLSLFPLDLQLDHDLPDRLIVPGHLSAYLLTFHGDSLIRNDNLGGSFTQFAPVPD